MLEGNYPESVTGWLSQATARLKAMQKKFGREFCDSFYTRYDGNRCARASPDSLDKEKWHGQSWCYVPSTCSKAAPLPRAPEWGVKMCEKGADKMLSDLAPEELVA